ncbi:TIGR00730 family Rossman fold protein [Leptospira langatensis]|uniref:Cytokinin riboside 5'-monophosphate phosphoribohydrolase n=1 Tax=Leptospira langatensis TaxID=2484983 RepID=A0A5F1ZTT3_9LEPT|nr:TIGR00730 family Rossman fold protein [Leptospira langatensis]TGK02937.1 TIGR00730 family Rossman fold protein [Leptospira langatensis]TGL41692.1 TIGR00730 family Rossman fold protein [Leptospira langatensis]
MKPAICVFCGSRPGKDPRYLQAAEYLGHLMASEGLGLVYGGATSGLMGAVADSVLEKGGLVIGVLPEFLSQKEIAHKQITELILVPTMHERKLLMYEKSIAFIALPGGIGTLEELVEVTSWNQLGVLSKPIGLLNVNGFFDPLLKQLDHMVEEGFLDSQTRDWIEVSSDPENLLERILKRTRLI